MRRPKSISNVYQNAVLKKNIIPLIKSKINFTLHMKKKYILLLIVVCFYSLKTEAQYTLTIEDVEFSNNTITDYINTNEKNIIIPHAFGDDKVLHIGSNAFSEPLEHVFIPNTVETIGYFALNNSNSPYPVTFEENSNIITIPQNSISGEFNLPTHASPNFHGYIHGNKVYQPGEKITMERNVFFFVDISYTLTDDDVIVRNNIIESCSYDFTYKHITIPEILDGEEIIKIGEAVFIEKEIFKVDFPSTLKIIGKHAFENNDFRSIIIPEGIEVIRNYAFGTNWNNTSVELPSTLDSIGSHSFYRNRIRSLVLGDNVKNIGYWAFEGNEIKNLTIPATIEQIGAKSFYGNQLESVEFKPNSKLKAIGAQAFTLDTRQHELILKEIILPTNSNPNFTNYVDAYGSSYNAGDAITDFESIYFSYIPYTLTDNDVEVDANGIIQSCSYNFDSKTIIIPSVLDGQIVKGTADYPNQDGLFYRKGLYSVELPAQFEKIGDGTFEENNLTTVNIPDRVNYIGENAYSGNQIKSLAFFESKKDGFTFTNWIDKYERKFVAGEEIEDLYYSYTAQFITGEVIHPEFYSNRREIVPDEEIQFIDASINTTPDTEYHWDFGDGSSSKKRNPVHIYNEVGTYNVTLNIKQGTEDKTSTRSAYINVVPWYTLTDSDVEVNNGIIISCNYNFENKNIIIPDILDNQVINGIGVIDWTGIGVFESKGIKRLQLPNSLNYIGYKAFAYNNLKEVVLPTALDKIGISAFTGSLDFITLPSSVKDGYIFKHWTNACDHIYTGNSKATTYSFCYNSIDKLHYHAVFESIQYPIEYYHNGSMIEVSPQSYTIEDKITLSPLELPGYQFQGWFTDAEYKDTISTPAIEKGNTSSFTFYAKSEIINYNITYHNTGTIRNHNPETYTVDEQFILRDLSDIDTTNYVFKGWVTREYPYSWNLDYYNEIPIDTIRIGTTGDLNIYAKWLPDGDEIFNSSNFNIYSHSPTCNDFTDGTMTITSEAFGIEVFVQETNKLYTINKEEILIIEDLTSGTYNINCKVVDGVERNFIVIVPAIDEIKSSVIIQGNTASFNIVGGKPPYAVQLNNTIYITETGEISLDNLNAAKYTAIVQDNNACTDDNILSFEIESFRIYPNPANRGVINVILPQSIEGHECIFRVLTHDGRIVIVKKEKGTNRHQIDINSLKANTYILQVNSNDYTNSVQFIVTE